MTTSTTSRRRNTRRPTRAASKPTRSNGNRSWKPRVPNGTGNIIGMVLLVVVAFVAGYLIGRAGPPVSA